MLKQIPVTLPRSFEEALGYPRGFRWVAFYWEPCGDEAMFDDGICSGDGNWWGFLQFVRHPSVVPWLSYCDLGSSDSEAKHWLLCDLESREVYVGERGEVRSFLVDEVKKYTLESGEISTLDSTLEIGELLAKVRDEMRQVPAPSMAEVEEKMRRDQEAVDKMVAELGR